LDETAEVKEIDVINKSTKLSNREECGSSSSSTGLSFQSNNCAFHFEIITYCKNDIDGVFYNFIKNVTTDDVFYKENVFYR
jgi:hypothetical protein